MNIIVPPLPVQIIDALATSINDWACRKGFWEFDVIPQSEKDAIWLRNQIKATKIMLVVTELAECVEGIRKEVPSSIEGFTNEEEEIADAIIRLLDYCGQYELRIGEAVLAKMAFNEGRPFRHGKAF